MGCEWWRYGSGWSFYGLLKDGSMNMGAEGGVDVFFFAKNFDPLNNVV